VYAPDDSLVDVETCRRDVNDKLLFITDGAVCWIKYCIVSILHGIWIALDWGATPPSSVQMTCEQYNLITDAQTYELGSTAAPFSLGS